MTFLISWFCIILVKKPLSIITLSIPNNGSGFLNYSLLVPVRFLSCTILRKVLLCFCGCQIRAQGRQVPVLKSRWCKVLCCCPVTSSTVKEECVAMPSLSACCCTICASSWAHWLLWLETSGLLTEGTYNLLIPLKKGTPHLAVTPDSNSSVFTLLQTVPQIAKGTTKGYSVNMSQLSSMAELPQIFLWGWCQLPTTFLSIL